MNKVKLFLLINILVLIVIGVEGIVWWKKTENKENKCTNCNVVLVSLDVLGSDYLPCYGYSKNTAPNLCKLANENITFQNSFSQSNWTLPSHFSMITSLLPSQHKMDFDFTKPLSTSIKTLPQVLKNNGYTTIFSGPDDQYQIPLASGISRGFDKIDADHYTDLKSRFRKVIKTLLNNGDKKNYYYFYTDYVHIPYLPNEILEGKFGIPMSIVEYKKVNADLVAQIENDLSTRLASTQTKESTAYILELINGIKDKSLEEKINYITKSFPKAEMDSYYLTRYKRILNRDQTPEKIAYINSLYDKKINEMDAIIGDFIDDFKKNNLDKNTILIFTSEHSDPMGLHGLVSDCNSSKDNCLYNEFVRVPAIWSVPKVSNKKIKNIFTSIDIFPTLLGVLGLKDEVSLQGEDMSGQFYLKKEPSENNLKVLQQNSGDIAFLDNVNKYYFKHDGDVQIYKILDLKEKTNLYNKNNGLSRWMFDDKIKKMRLIANKMKNTDKNIGFPAWLDEQKKQKLINEGYF